jgi:hypothetical protein
MGSSGRDGRFDVKGSMETDLFANDSSDRNQYCVLAAGAHRGGGLQALAHKRVQRHRGHRVVHLEPHAHQARLELLPAPARARRQPANESLHVCRQLFADTPKVGKRKRARIMAAEAPVNGVSTPGVG